MMASAVLSRVTLGSSNTRCLLYLQVCLYATLEKFQITVHTGLDFSTPSFSTPWPFTTNHFGKHCSNSPHLSCTSPLHDIYFPVQHLHRIQDWNILVRSRTCQVPRDQLTEERDSHVSPVRAVCDKLVIHFSLPRRLNSKTLLQWSSPLTFQCQVWMFCSNSMNHTVI